MPHSIVILGASGDLTSRKLVPALFNLHQKGRLPRETRVVGVSRTPFEHHDWRRALEQSTAGYLGGAFQQEAWDAFAPSLFYCRGDIQQADDFGRLGERLDDVEGGGTSTRIYYLSTLPQLYAHAVRQLGDAGLADESCGPRRVVIEKPFGIDVESARRLNHDVHRVFREDQIYRIDHYLGKETVQNLLVLRFANSIFEPIWNHHYVDHVQITVAEEVMVGRRGGYYDRSGVLRDMVQNHLLQLMMVTAMEAPARFDSDLVRDEKVKVLRSVRTMTEDVIHQDTLRGQYAGYLQEEGVGPNSQTATFAALKLHIDNWRWSGVPFYLRTGKAMSCRTTQIVIQFRKPPQMLFREGPRHGLDANRLVIQIQPAEGIQLQFQTKIPDAGMKLRLTDLDFSFQREFASAMPDAYQRLLLDALNGDASLFARSDEVELSWSLIDPIISTWMGSAAPPLHIYPSGMWGPEMCTQWMGKQQREWFDVCPVLDPPSRS